MNHNNTLIHNSHHWRKATSNGDKLCQTSYTAATPEMSPGQIAPLSWAHRCALLFWCVVENEKMQAVTELYVKSLGFCHSVHES